MSSPLNYQTATALEIRELSAADLGGVIEIDALHTGKRKPEYWLRVFAEFLSPTGADGKVGLAAAEGEKVLGYLLGDVRAFEFGSGPCGWIFAIGVEPRHSRQGIAARLLREAAVRFRAAGVETVRTMVRRADVPVLSFFRSSGFVGGPFYQLELALEEAE